MNGNSPEKRGLNQYKVVSMFNSDLKKNEIFVYRTVRHKQICRLKFNKQLEYCCFNCTFASKFEGLRLKLIRWFINPCFGRKIKIFVHLRCASETNLPPVVLKTVRILLF